MDKGRSPLHPSARPFVVGNKDAEQHVSTDPAFHPTRFRRSL
jgi:hypothetical protein